MRNVDTLNQFLVSDWCYKHEDIDNEAVKRGMFGNSFKLDRMTWMKPSFLWMMNRCGWGIKENQEHILAIDIKRNAFDFII